METQRIIIAIFSGATCEKIMETLEDTLRKNHDWAVDRIHFLAEDEIEDAYAIQSEFSEWLDPNIADHDIFSLEYLGDSNFDLES